MYDSIDGGSTKMNNKKLHNEFADSSALAFPVELARALYNMGLWEFLLLKSRMLQSYQIFYFNYYFLLWPFTPLPFPTSFYRRNELNEMPKS